MTWTRLLSFRSTETKHSLLSAASKLRSGKAQLWERGLGSKTADVQKATESGKRGDPEARSSQGPSPQAGFLLQSLAAEMKHVTGSLEALCLSVMLN